MCLYGRGATAVPSQILVKFKINVGSAAPRLECPLVRAAQWGPSPTPKLTEDIGIVAHGGGVGVLNRNT